MLSAEFGEGKHLTTGIVALLALAFFVFVTGPYCLTYLAYRAVILYSARVTHAKKPAALFVLSVVSGFVWLFGTPALVILGTVGHGKRWEDVYLALLLASVALGAVGWLILAVVHFKRQAAYRAYIRAHPAPKFQMWLQDIVIATFSLGLSMTAIINLGAVVKEQSAIVTLAVYELITHGVMFFTVLDACRFSERLKAPRARAMYVFALMFLNAFVPLPILTALSWNVWRRALFLAKTEKVTLAT